MTEPSSKKRIFQIAKELNISHQDIIDFLTNENVKLSGLNASIEHEDYEKVLGEFSKDKKKVERFRKEQARKEVVDTRRKVDIKREAKKKSIEKKFEGIKKDSKQIKKKTDNGLHSLKEKIQKEQNRLSVIKKIEEEEKLKIERLEQKLKEAEEEKLSVEAEIAEKAKKEQEEKEKSKGKLKILHKPSSEKKKIDEQKKAAEKQIIKKEKRREKPRIAAKQKQEIITKKPEKTTQPTPKTAPKDIKKPIEKKTKHRKLKKIDIATIADKINRTRTKKSKSSDKSKKASTTARPTLPQFGKKISKKKSKKSTKINKIVPEKTGVKKIIKVPEFTSLDELARSMDISANEIIKVCLGLGLMVTINQRLDMETIILIADEFEIEVETPKEVGEELLQEEITEEDKSKETPRPPVVTIMGHVDHGKTSLLDFIRNSNVVAGESGGITQHIGAYELLLKTGEKITFLDTPGHAAFTAMRARGAQVTDIVVVIIAADDGIMPQTVEAIDHAKAAGVPIIIAINKIDKPNSDIEKIKRELSERNILVEDWGGKYQSSEISAITGVGIDDLLEKILLEASILDLTANTNVLPRCTIIESRLDKGLGPVATLLVHRGILKIGQIFVCGTQYSRIRAILNERNHRLKEAYPSDPVQILGFNKVPSAGENFTILDNEHEARKIALHRSQLKREAEQRRFRHISLEQIGQQIAEGEVRNLEIIIKGDVDGSIEALSDSLMGLSTKEVAVNIIHRSVGMITEADVSLAAASRAVIIAFHVSPTAEAKEAAKINNIDIRNYTIIYNAVNDVKLALEGLLRPESVEKALGIAEVRALFKIGRKEVIAGSYIRSGKAVRNAMLRVMRDGEKLHEGKLTSLKRFKNDTNEVKEGFECGISVDGFSDFLEGDNIEFYEIKTVKRTLL